MDLRSTARLCSSLAAVALEEASDLLLPLAVIAIHAVAAATLAQIRVVSPLLRAGAPRQNRSLIHRASLLSNQLCLVSIHTLLKALPVLDCGCLAHAALKLTEVV